MLRLVSHNKFAAYDSHILDAYFVRMASTSDVYGITASEDIQSASGALLIKRGATITPEIANVLAASHLRRAIEGCVRFEREVDTHKLREDLLAIMHNDPLLLSLNEHQDIAGLIESLLPSYEQYRLLKQKLSVMAVSMPELYRRTLYCTWFSTVIAKEMRFSERGCTDVFLSALSHDIGMLHINQSVLDKKTPLTAEDWRHIQSHVHIGKQLMQRMPDMPHDVIEAVFEHHERCDGTGYPLGKVEAELSYAGKIVGLSDSIIAIYHNRFKDHNWREVIPVIQMNAPAYFYRHGEILATIWRRSQMPFKNVVVGDELPQFIAELLQTNGRLKSWFEILRDSLLNIGFTHGDRQLHSVQNIMLHLSSSIKGSGIFDPQTLEWLQHFDVHGDTDAYRHIEKAHVQHHEIIFHLQRLNRMIRLYLDSNPFKRREIKAVLAEALEQVKEFML
jgi:HD-GYP domain-containing protein (c-di-GMP phosphodiesterase class II)